MKKPGTDGLIVAFHWLSVSALLLSLVTGFTIAADAADAVVSRWLAAIVPVADSFVLHALAGLALAGLGMGYLLYLGAAGLGRRFAITPERRKTAQRQGRRLAWQLRNVRIYLALFAVIGISAVSGFVLFFDVDLVSHAASWAVEQAHLAAAWVLLALVLVHVAAQYALGAAGRGSRSAAAAGLDWVLKMCRPRARQVAGMPADQSLVRTAAAGFGVTAQQLAMCLAGCVLFSLGVKLFITAGLGVDPLHAMAIGIVAATGVPLVSVGAVISLVTLLMLALWSLWRRRLPPVSTLITMVLVGYLVDLWNLLDLERWLVLALDPLPMLLTGILLNVYASALTVMSGIGIRVMDLWAVGLQRRCQVPFFLGKFLFEASFAAVGAWLGGPLGPATIAFVLAVGIAAEPCLWANRRLLRLPDYGLRRDAAHA